MDFTLKKYQELLHALQRAGYVFLTFEEYCRGDRPPRFVVLRHDVDDLAANSLRFAQLQAHFGIRASYYFRAVPQSWDEAVIKGIASLGHEVGYHYENLTTHQGDKAKAIADFQTHLHALRQLVTVRTICMHGSPRSPYDSKALWDAYDYHDFGIIGEPYFDVDFDKVFYLTDTGRRWDGWRSSVRDKVPQQTQWLQSGLVYGSTDDILAALKAGDFPNSLMMTFHPQRWHDKPRPWLRELLVQNIKNAFKKLFLVRQT